MGAIDYITKPFRPPIVRARVKNLLAREELRQKVDELRRQFTAMIVHDLRSPLTVIRGFAEMAMDDNGPDAKENRTSALQRVIDNADRARLLVDQMLDLSQLQAGKVRLRRVPTDFTKLLRNIVRDHMVLARSKRIGLEESIAANLRATVDPAKIAETLANLIGNALKFTPAGGRITLAGDADAAGTMCVKVSDTGTGIPPDILGRLFSPWEHAASPMRQTLKSYGLGLAICKMIVEARGGDISVESVPGSGTTFSFRLPPG
ncbi:MAG: hypothetical protein HY303_13500 [Candidatus Wallbacteria bacterium]|nr:hypothetical protein [Candidatus Wallbacteria bacterium]